MVLGHPVLSAGGCIPAACSCRKLGRARACAAPQCTLDRVRAHVALVWPAHLVLSQRHHHSWHECRRAVGRMQLLRCSDLEATMNRHHEPSPWQLLFLITLTIATNSTRGPKVPVSCACSMVLNWGIWGQKPNFFPHHKNGCQAPSCLKWLGESLPTSFA